MSAVTEHNYQADQFSKLTPLLSLVSLSLRQSETLLCVLSVFMPVFPLPIIPIFATFVCFSLLTLVSLSETVCLVLFFLFYPLSQAAFLRASVCFACCSLSSSHLSLLIYCKLSFSTACFISPALLQASALCCRL